LILLVLFLPSIAWCQLEKGSYVNSATAGFTFQNNHYPSGDAISKSGSLDFYLNNSFGIFVANRVVIGPGFNIGAGYNYSTYTGSPTESSKYVTYSYAVSLDPFFRYYFFQHGKLALFGQVSAMIGYGEHFQSYTHSNQATTKTTYDNLDFGGGLSVGLVYFITRNIGLETAMGYELSSNKTTIVSDSRNTTGALYINTGFSIYLGKCNKKEKDKDQDKPANP